MATFYTDPSITTRGMRQPESISEMLTRFAQLQQFGDERRYNRLREQEMSLKLEELRRTERDALARRGAIAAGEQLPQTGVPANLPPAAPGAGPMPQPQAPPMEFDRQAALRSLAQSAPHLVPEMQQGFATQDMAQQEAAIKAAKDIEGLSTEQLKNHKAKLEVVGQLLQSVKINPASYPNAKAYAEKQGLIPPGVLPEQASPEMFQKLDNILMSAHERVTTEETHRDNLAREQRKPVPGVDVPLSPEVFAQHQALKPPSMGATTRSDKSYQYTNNELTKVGEPIETAVARLGRLQDTINEVTPQADALIAPELLTVMAGGQGSGLRMNEAEIARIIGGRTNVESLKAALNKWQTDPSKGLSVTPAQREQIRSLVGVVNRKLLSKQAILDEARHALIDSEDPKDHRRIVAGAREKLSQIDRGGGGGPQTGETRQHQGATYKFDGTQWVKQ